MGCCGQVRTKETESISKEVNVSLLKKTKIIKHTIRIWKWKTVDSKKYQKTVKSFFSNKSNNFENLSLVENGKLLTDFEIVETFSKCFQNVVPNLDLKVPNNLLSFGFNI